MLLLFSCLLWTGGPIDYWDDMVRVRRHLHENPELSNREFKTHDFLRMELEKAGFSNIETMAKTGLRVVYDTGRPGPVLAFRADIDALPVTEATGLPFASKNDGVMHACGHDLHTGILFGTALAIKNAPNLIGKFVFLFQPAEEGPPPGETGGAPLMISDGALVDPKPDVIFGLHGMGFLPVGTIGWKTNGIMARADRFRIKIEGKQAHGSTPEKGIDPIFIASEVVTGAQSIASRRIDSREPVVLSFGEFNAGQRFNIIPGSASLTGTIRSFDPETGDRIPQLLDEILSGITSAHGATYKFENETMCPSTQNDPAWTAKAVDALSQAGIKTVQVDPVLAAEDFAFFAEQIPGVYLFNGVCSDEPCTNIHSPDFNPDEEAMKTGAAYFFTMAKTFASSDETL